MIEGSDEDKTKNLIEAIKTKWTGLQGISSEEAKRQYLTIVRKWNPYGSVLFFVVLLSFGKSHENLAKKKAE
jgi:hypothetical protein